jgi:hypothetical protein
MYSPCFRARYNENNGLRQSVFRKEYNVYLFLYYFCIISVATKYILRYVILLP